MNDLPIAGIGHNRPPEPLDTAAAAEKRVADPIKVADLIKTADEWAEKYPAPTQVESVAAADRVLGAANEFLNQLDAHWNELDAARIAEKRPHDIAAAAVQAKYKPQLDKIDLCRRAVKALHNGWLKLKGARERADRERDLRAAAEEQRRADQLAEQAKAGGPGTVTNLVNSAEAAQEAERLRQRAVAIPQRPQSRGAISGRARSLRTAWLAKVVEWNLLYEHYKDHPDVKDVLQELANAAVRAQGGPRPPAGQKEGSNPKLPGVWIYAEEQ
jgi:hypothetical protein